MLDRLVPYFVGAGSGRSARRVIDSARAKAALLASVKRSVPRLNRSHAGYVAMRTNDALIRFHGRAPLGLTTAVSAATA